MNVEGQATKLKQLESELAELKAQYERLARKTDPFDRHVTARLFPRDPFVP